MASFSNDFRKESCDTQTKLPKATVRNIKLILFISIPPRRPPPPNTHNYHDLLGKVKDACGTLLTVLTVRKSSVSHPIVFEWVYKGVVLVVLLLCVFAFDCVREFILGNY